MKNNYNSLNGYLNEYYNKYQENIILVYRGNEHGDWANRCLYLSKEYSPMVKYNHRSILDDEVVIEFDIEDKQLNKILTEEVCKRLREDKIAYSRFFSGGKSQHVHLLMNKFNVANRSLLKKAIMEYYGIYYYDKGKKKVYLEQCDNEPKRVKYVCDLKLAGNHLIRAEYGIHEKTQERKTLISKTPGYPQRSEIKIEIFKAYERSMERSVRTRIGMETSNIEESDVVKQLMDTVKFQENMNDGRERVIWQLIQVLKKKFKEKENGFNELVDLMDEWYGYCSTQPRKMNKQEIIAKVKYHWNRDITVTINTLKRTIEEISN